MAAAANDDLDGGDGNDRLWGELGADRLFGGAGDDRIVGDGVGEYLVTSSADGDDYLDGGAGNDRLFGYGGADVILGGDGDDDIEGGTEDDLLGGSDSDTGDVLRGGAGRDSIFGYIGDDQIFGDAGNDLLWGMNGSDVLTGGTGADQFKVAHDDLREGGTDVITDFVRGEDTLAVTGRRLADGAELSWAEMFRALDSNGDGRRTGSDRYVDPVASAGRVRLKIAVDGVCGWGSTVDVIVRGVTTLTLDDFT